MLSSVQSACISHKISTTGSFQAHEAFNFFKQGLGTSFTSGSGAWRLTKGGCASWVSFGITEALESGAENQDPSQEKGAGGMGCWRGGQFLSSKSSGSYSSGSMPFKGCPRTDVRTPCAHKSSIYDAPYKLTVQRPASVLSVEQTSLREAIDNELGQHRHEQGEDWPREYMQ